MTDDTPKRRRGRPSNAELAAKAPGGRGRVGRPAGDAKMMAEYKAMMLTSPRSKLVLEKVFDVALDDEHKAQAACLKIVTDRLLPVADFVQDKDSKGVSGIRISIGVSSPDATVEVGETYENDVDG